MNKFMYTRADGGVSVVIPAPKSNLEQMLGPLTDDEYIMHVKSRSVPPDATNVTDVMEEDLPDREFRDSWIQQGSKIGFDLIKAQDTQLARIRQARVPQFSKLDVLYNMALEKNDVASQQAVAQQKQALRDITEPLKALQPSSIDDIKNAFPDSLKGAN